MAIVDTDMDKVRLAEIREALPDLHRLISEYMTCNKAIANSVMDTQSFVAGGQHTVSRDRKANELCTWVLMNGGAFDYLLSRVGQLERQLAANGYENPGYKGAVSTNGAQSED